MNGVETEIKLQASPAMLEALRQHPLLEGVDHMAQLVTTYFDTPDGRLRRCGASLRLRRSDGRLEQTFKQAGQQPAAQTGGAAPVRREEWNAPAIGDCPEPARFPPAAAAALARMIDGASLAPFAVVSVQRHTRRIRRGDTLIEVAFDAGQIAAAGRGEPVCELELELVEGHLGDLLALARCLPLGPALRWSVAAKGQRAFALARGEPLGPVRATKIVLAPTMSQRDAFQAICWNCLDHLLGNYSLLIDRGNNDALHQCRVAIRRLRAALGIFADSLDSDATQHVRGAFGVAATVMGPARELHVLLEALAQAGAPATGSELIPQLMVRRDTALLSAAAQLNDDGFQRLLFTFASWIETVETRPTPQSLPQFAATVLNRNRKRVKQAGHQLHAISDDGLHRLRIKVKKLRYAVEFFASLAVEPAVAEAYAEALGKLQDRLGALHDLSERSAQGPLFAGLPSVQQERWQAEVERLLGPATAVRADLVDGSARMLAKLLALPRWWQADSGDTDLDEPDMARDKHMVQDNDMAQDNYMTKNKHDDRHRHPGEQLRALQIRLSAMQREVIAQGRKLVIIFEGRDAAGKDGTIKHVVEHMSPRDTHVVALGVPTEHDRKAWYFQRYCAELPAAGEIALFNRSWYNRAGVEQVMGFCTDAEYEDFMENVLLFEQLLIQSGFTIIKYYLDVSKAEQKRRLRDRETNPLKQWKISPIDKQAGKNWAKYSVARNAMLARTHTVLAPWVVVKADDKPQAHLAVIRDLLARCGAGDLDGRDLDENNSGAPATAFTYDAQAMENGWLEK